MIEHDKFIFLHMPRCAGSFVSHFLVNIFQGHRHNENGIETLGYSELKNNKIETEGKFVFGCIRNPWAWYVSWFAFAVTSKPVYASPFYELVKDKHFDNFLYSVFGRRGGNTKDANPIDFEIMYKYEIGALTYRYIKMYMKDPDYVFTISNDIQQLIDRHDELIGVDKVLHCNKLEEDIITLFKQQNLELDREQDSYLYNVGRVNTSMHPHYTAMYDIKGLPELIEQKEQFIIEKFGFTFTGHHDQRRHRDD